MPKAPPESTRISVGQRLRDRARTRWPELTAVTVTHRGPFTYLTATLPDGEQLPLCRLRYNGSASLWGFAVYLASTDKYQDSLLPTGLPIGSPEDALDTACGLYLGDPTAWITPPTN